jgi:diguanylate cyclase (GGDEF)-like protein
MRETEEPIDLKAHGEFHVFRDFMFHFIPLVLVAILVVVVGLGAQKRLRTERIKTRELQLVEQETRMIRTELAVHARDALFVADVLGRGFPICTDATLRAALTRNLLTSLSRVRGVYDQVRFVDVSGRELVRVNRKQGRPYLVEEGGLQNKSTRPYVIHGLKASRGEVLVSRFDLNMEHGALECPLKPVIRFATPVDDPSGNRRGVIVLNYLGSKLIDMIKEISTSGDGEGYLINNQGYWLIGLTPEEEWGFMLDNEAPGHVRHRFPEFWEYVKQHEQGQIVLDDDLFTFAKMAPSMANTSCDVDSSWLKESEHWILISRVSMDVMGREYLMVGLPLALVAFIGLGGVAMRWTLARQREHLATARLVRMATRDGLTGLHNRKHFVHCVDAEIERAKRYDRPLSLVLFDIDHFKRVNDTYGHAQGDAVLRALAGTVRETCREQDIPGRVGGEEFAVLLPETGREQAAAMAERLRQAVEQIEVGIDGEKVIRFTISVGVISLERAGSDTDFQTLFTRVDALMYQAKEGGRNRVVVG